MPCGFIDGWAMINVNVRANECNIFSPEHVKRIFALAGALEMEVNKIWWGEVKETSANAVVSEIYVLGKEVNGWGVVNNFADIG